MNLLAYTAGMIETVNPRQTLGYRASTGYANNAQHKQVPSYATPAAFIGSVVGGVLTVTSITVGQLGPEQAINELVAGTFIQAQLSGTPGGVGTYQVYPTQDALSQDLTSSLPVQGQVQPLQYKDLMQIDGLNLNGTRRKIYLYGAANGVVRTSLKGGDLITDPRGDVWLVALVAEQWAVDWASAIVTLQNGS
jgi:hypothetical protein